MVDRTENRVSYGMRTVSITGNEKQVEYAKKMIEEKIVAENLMDRKFQRTQVGGMLSL